jgi:hypothetical protein
MDHNFVLYFLSQVPLDFIPLCTYFDTFSCSMGEVNSPIFALWVAESNFIGFMAEFCRCHLNFYMFLVVTSKGDHRAIVVYLYV